MYGEQPVKSAPVKKPAPMVPREPDALEYLSEMDWSPTDMRKLGIKVLRGAEMIMQKICGEAIAVDMEPAVLRSLTGSLTHLSSAMKSYMEIYHECLAEDRDMTQTGQSMFEQLSRHLDGPELSVLSKWMKRVEDGRE